jgi:Conjugative transposon protein TcpC
VGPKRKNSRARSNGASARTSALAGRIRARWLRYAFAATVALLSIAGLRGAIFPPPATVVTEASAGQIDYAEADFASQFARAYLSYDAGQPAARESALAPFVSESLDLTSSFSPPDSGSQSVTWTDIAQVQRPLAGGVIFTVAVGLSSQPAPVYLSVPVRRVAGSAIALNGYPSFVGPPLTAPAPADEGERESVQDAEVTRLVTRALTNYLAGDAEDFSADLAQAATVTLPPNHLELEDIQELVWVRGSGGGGVLATVGVSDEQGARYTLQYEIGVRRVEAGDPQIAPAWRITYVQTLSQES